MDWFTWLSRTSLDPSLVYDYGRAFTQNELVEADMFHFDHEFLQSMGISIAKHRLEILKLKKNDLNRTRLYYMAPSRVLIVIKCAMKHVTRYLRRRASHEDDVALSLVPRRSQSTRWRDAMVMIKRRKSSSMRDHGVNKVIRLPQLLITNGSPDSMMDSLWSSYVDEKDNWKGNGVRDRDEHWSCEVEAIKWDAMFKNLKPT